MSFSPPRRRKRLDVLIPSSFSKDTPHLREKTLRAGILARTLAASRVDTLILYHEDPENPEKVNAEQLKLLMDYLNTAPYLRRRLYPLRRELRYVGILPPLNIPTHPESPSLEVEHWREGLVVSSNRVSVVEAGLGKPLKLRRRLRKGARIILHLKPGKHGVRVKATSWRKAAVYPGFRTAIVEEPLREVAEAYDYRVATSRYGQDIKEALPTLKTRLGEAEKICVAFGSQRQGLREILQQQGSTLEEAFDVTVNTLPNQGVRTIRTEEAVAYTLAILNLVLA